MTLLAGIVVTGFGFFLIILAWLGFVKPALFQRFIRSFASSARAHYTEQVLRLLIGAALVVLAPATWHTALFRVVGWLIFGTAVGLIILPWRWHWWFGQLVIPRLLRHLKLYAVGLFAFGVFLLSGVFSAGLKGPT
jgi:hypothetical protein